jgi:uracil-DNA glycosylase
VEVVILGQDPYHGRGRRTGCAFGAARRRRAAVAAQHLPGTEARPRHLPPPAHGCLESWATQGVLLLNSVLTVERGRAASHQGRGWERFTDRVVEVLSARREHLVFLLWGSYAERKGRIIDRERHLVLSSPHPSPLSAHRGFIGNGHFSAANRYLEAHGKRPIDWRLSP